MGRAVLPALKPYYRIRSVHRHPTASEGPEIEWIPADARTVPDWAPLLSGCQIVLNLAWYRWESESTFRALHDGLCRLVDAAKKARVERFLQVSVPSAPESLETGLPYLVYKRRVDATVSNSGLSYRIVRPTMLFGRDDVLVSVMMRTIRRYHFLPMFGDGSYHVSPVATSDLARVLLQEAQGSAPGTLDLGGPERLTYRELADRIFLALGKRPRYWRLSATGARRLTRLMVALGSTTLYPYEVEWLMSDKLGLPAYEGLAERLQPVGPYIDQLARA